MIFLPPDLSLIIGNPKFELKYQFPLSTLERKYAVLSQAMHVTAYSSL
jgi:hypothetical protein